MRQTVSRYLALVVLTALVSLSLSGVASAATPTVPAGLTATGGNKSVVLAWSAASNSPTDYIIEYSSDGFVFTSSLFYELAASTAVTATVTGLTNGTLYTFRVKAFNGNGTSAASATAVGTPYSNHTPNDLAVFDACPASLITAAGFTDTTSPDVACIKHYGITKGTTATTYSPIEFVSRWQMALFLTRMVVPAGATLPSGVDQGFTDISGKSAEIQTAINQIKQLGITVGKTATTFAPDAYVTREEMALFITRLLKAVPTGPGGNEEFVSGTSGSKVIKSLDTDHNFTDLGLASIMEAQNAVINLWNLGVTEVSTATKYQPTVNISRLNMAQMMARALDHTNARPAGLNIQANFYTGASAKVLKMSVTHRSADFLPITGSLIDSFRWGNPTTTGYARFSSDGSCAQVVATVISLIHCYVDGSEQATDATGNLAVFQTALVAGSIWEYYVWTAAAGTTYDNDVHGAGSQMITILG
jgi:hypothetical protein